MDRPLVHLMPDGTGYAATRNGQVVATARLRRDGEHWSVQVTPADPEALAALLDAAGGLADRLGGSDTWWVVARPDAAHDRAADAAGFEPWRDVHQLRRELPVGRDERVGVPAAAVRPFRPGTDEDAWLEVNRRSFAGHPEQGGRRLSELRELEAEPWFDPAGFLLLDAAPTGPRAGTLDGFCWTRVHPATGTDPALGEIYVIGVDPSAGGRGLGRALTIAGLDHLAAAGVTVAMLYVEASNQRARAMYERLGFAHHHTDRVYRRSPA